ncbi:hypothetical protein SUDANB178_04445 [Streptomyces sp. enrichment culture]
MVRRFAGRGPVDGPRLVLMSPDNREVDRDDPVEVTSGVGLSEQRGEDLFPDPVGGPLPQRLWAPFQEPKRSGKSIHGVPVRYLIAIASITCR